MADAPTPATPVIPAAEAAPAVPPPAVVPVEAAPPAPAPVVKPEAPSTAKVEPPATVSLLGEAASKEAPPVEPAKTDEPPKEPVAEAAPPSEPIKYEPFVLPETFERDEAAMNEFTKTLEEIRAPQEFGQKLVDLYAREATKLYESQQKYFADTVNGWKEDVLADPELGGNRTQTVLRSCGAVLEQFGSPELRQMFNLTGTGNHPEMVRFLNKIGKFLGEGTPVRAEKPVPEVKPSRAARRYANPQG